MLRRFMWIACGVLLGFSSVGGAAADTPVDLKNHGPRFHWKTGLEGRQSIYDGQMLVADFYPGPKDPKAMHGIGRPISLHNLRLIPGGQLAIANGEGCGPLCLVGCLQLDVLRGELGVRVVEPGVRVGQLLVFAGDDDRDEQCAR